MSFVQKLIHWINSLVDFAMLLIFVCMLMAGGYSLWDQYTVNEIATQKQYQAYKPEKKDMRSFQEFQKQNPDVIGWLQIEGTEIDFPLLQTTNNDTYLNTAPDGTFAVSGSVFLDYRNSPNFDDGNSIIYGHHMDQHKMFGDIAQFKDPVFFKNHPYGRLFFNNQEHGLEFIRFLEADAYDSLVFSPAAFDQKAFRDHMDTLALCHKEVDLKERDQLIFLSTCASMNTNGRHILVARLMDSVPILDKAEKTKRANECLWKTE